MGGKRERERKDRNENESKDGRDTESNNSQTAESTITHCSIKRHHRFQILEKYIFTLLYVLPRNACELDSIMITPMRMPKFYCMHYHAEIDRTALETV
jgi:hypothetical protein